MRPDKTIANPAGLSALANGDLKNAAVAFAPGGIERQEAAGQADLVSTFTRLPKDMGDGGREIAELLGFVFGADVDDLFVAVMPPPGWTLRPTEHSMGSIVRDEIGRERALVFYKAAFYDRKAHLSWHRRFHVRSVYEDDGRFSAVELCDKACILAPVRVVIEPVAGETVQEQYARGYRVQKLMWAFEEAALPDRMPLAYWNEPDLQLPELPADVR